MSWFTDFLTDTARQAAPGIHQGINTDIQRKQRLGEMEQQIPILVKQQQALMPGEIEKVDAISRAAQARDAANQEAAFRRAIALQYLKNQTKAQPPDDPIGRVLGGKYTMSNPNYSASEEAAGPMGQAPTENVGGLEWLRRVRDVPSGHIPEIRTDAKGTSVEWKAPHPVGVGGPRDAIGEYSRERRAAEKEADDLGLTGQDWSSHVTTRMAGYRQAQSTATGAGSAIGGNTGTAQTAKVNTAGKMGEERAAGGVRGELRPIQSPSQPGVMVPGVTAVGEARESGKVPTQVQKKVSELERTRSLIDQLDTLSKPLVTAKDWTGVLPQYVKLNVGAFTRANEAAALYQSTVEEFLGQLAREVSQERGVLTNQDITRIKNGMPNFGDTVGLRQAKIDALKNIVELNQGAEEARVSSGGRIPDSVRMASRQRLNDIMSSLGKGGGQSVPSSQETKTINGKTYIKQNGRWYEQ